MSMQGTNKRPLPDQDLHGTLPSKRARHDPHSVSPPIPDQESSPSSTCSSPTLVGSIPTSPPSLSLRPTESDDTNSATSSVASTPEILEDFVSTSSSSSDGSSDISIHQPALTLQWQRLIAQQYHDSSTTSPSGESFTSTSPSISDDLSSSSVSSSSNAAEGDNRSPSSSSGVSTPSLPARASTRTLTAKNLSRLQQRLDSLLPRLQTANEQLEKDRAEGKLEERNIENVEENEEGGGKGYIEMDLGLGVLEEKGSRKYGEEMDEDSGEGSSVRERPQRAKVHAIGKLLGKPERKRKEKDKIEEIGDE